MRITIVPLKKVGEVAFGMSRMEVRAHLGDATEFYKFEDDTNTTDDYGFCHVFYDENDTCEAIEVFDDVEVYVGDTLVFPTDIETARRTIPDLEEDEDGLMSLSQSIGIYAPDDEMESILIGREGYYDEE